MTDREKIVEIMAIAIAWFFDENDTPDDAAKAALKALEEAGYVIVPKEPTDEMVSAGQKPNRTIHDHSYLTAHSVETRYKAMIQAAQGEER